MGLSLAKNGGPFAPPLALAKPEKVTDEAPARPSRNTIDAMPDHRRSCTEGRAARGEFRNELVGPADWRTERVAPGPRAET